ncbi:hypothetical protein ACVVIX_005182 [Escherichia coli]
MNNESSICELKVPHIVKAIWNYYGNPSEHLWSIPKKVQATVLPEYTLTCREVTDMIDRYIEQYPQKAIEHGLIVWFGELKCYQKSGDMDTEHVIWVSCIGRGYERQDDGSFIELPREVICHSSNNYWRQPLPWAEGRLQEMSDYDIDMNSLAPHRIVCYFPGNPMPKMWSKLFDACRNGIPSGMIKSGGKYYIIEYGKTINIVDMEVIRKGRKVFPKYPNGKGGTSQNHIADHVFNDTAQEPGVHLWFTCRLVLPDINRLNNHSSANNDRDCLSYPPPQPSNFAQQIQYDPWQYVEYTQLAIHDPYRFDRTGDRAIRYYLQMIRQYFSCINNGCQPVDLDEYDWCEVMK